MSNLQDPFLLSSPSRKGNELTRSVSDAQNTAAMKSHHHHLHHPHLPGHHHRRREREAHSASPKTSVDHLFDPRNDGVVSSKVSSKGSRRQSLLGREEFDGSADAEVRREREVAKPGQVKREKEKSALRATELRESLVELNTLSNTTTRQLDSTYYSVLEKHSVLQSTISSLRDLALTARSLPQEFSAESTDLISDIDTQLTSFQNFTSQKQKIEAYAERISQSRKRIRNLSARLDGVRTVVESWEKSEGEWRVRARRRLRILWTVMITCVFVFVVLLILQYSPGYMRRYGDAAKGADRIRNTVDFDVLGDEGIGGKVNESENRWSLFDRGDGNIDVGVDDRLRLFDEL